ncbi:MAG TPA: hypothetical protein VLA19_02505 [Herpetosiphonaceae bacterium]|nr:hypothetical protein [Herpetosiphonaceae bacterium]
MATLQSKRAFIPVILFRWSLLALAAWMISVHTTPSYLVERPALVGALLLLMATYLVVWSRRLNRLAQTANRRPLLLLADLGLSMFPVWATGGWSSPLLPFAFGALMLPSVLFGWRGSLVAIVAYLVVDQIVGWNTWQPGMAVPLASPGGILSYTWPVLAAMLWPVGVELWRRAPRRPAPSVIQATLAARPSALVAARRLPPPSASAGSAAEAPARTATVWTALRPHPQTIERAAPIEVRAAILQAVAEAEGQGLTVHLVMEGAELVLPPGHVQLLTRAIEVALDNVRRHAGAHEAEVTLAGEEGSLLLTVRDHGNGLLDGTAEPPGFHQIKRLRYRVEELEGTLAVQDNENGGVAMCLRIPLS